MRKRSLILACLLECLATAPDTAAVIRGTVVENLTGKALARTVITVQPIEGTPGSVRSLRANTAGAFEFESLAPGAYLVKAARLGFMPVEYGQKRWNSAGKPVTVEEKTTAFLNLRMLRYSAVLGTLLDENYVGLPEHDVAAYRNTKPPQLAGQGKTDDRGIFRIHSLEPGEYVVRTIGKQYEDESYVPTFSKETQRLDQAHTVDLPPEQEVGYMDVRPIAGRLFSLLLGAAPPPGYEITLTLASDMGRKTVKAASFLFTGLAPGDYEVSAEAQPSGASTTLLPQAGYQRIVLGRDSTISLLLQSPASIALDGAPAGDPGKAWIRHKDLAGVGAAAPLPINNGKAAFPIGHWEILWEPPGGYYVSNFGGPGISPTGRGRADGWNDVLSTRSYSGLRFTAAPGGGSIRGVVKSSSEQVAGAPVFLEPYDPADRKRDGDLRTTRADLHGNFHFEGLGPGAYRILGTFEYLAPDAAAMDTAAAPIMILEPRSQLTRELELYVIP